MVPPRFSKGRASWSTRANGRKIPGTTNQTDINKINRADDAGLFSDLGILFQAGNYPKKIGAGERVRTVDLYLGKD